MLFLYKNLSMKKKENTTIFELFFDWVNNLLSSNLKANPLSAPCLDVNEVLSKRSITIIEENKYEFNVKQEEIYEALSALTRKIPNDIQIYYEDGSIRISA